MTVWEDVIGQPGAVAALQQASSNPQAMTHAWLITGPPGSGRSLAARAFAAALQCDYSLGPHHAPSPHSAPAPHTALASGTTQASSQAPASDTASASDREQLPGCGKCQGCTTVLAGTHPDVRLLATDKVTISIDEVRELVGLAARMPALGRRRIIIVEDADRMVERTTNVLLKAIEEPPPHTVWLLCAPYAQDVLPTIVSRCRTVTLRIPPPAAVADLLVRQEGVDYDTALASAQAAQSHVGYARRLARDVEARQRRQEVLEMAWRIRSVGDAVLAADRLIQLAHTEGAAQVEERSAAQRAQLLRTLGVEDGKPVPPKLRGQIKALEDDHKRQATRAGRDVLDRCLLDLITVYRDVLTYQLGTGSMPINGHMALTRDLAGASQPEQTLHRIDAVALARQRLAGNVAPLLALEAMFMSLR